MNAFALIKPITTFVVGTSVGLVVQNAVKATTPANLKTSAKVFVAIGSFVAGSALGDQASKYVVNQINEFIEPLTDKRL